MANNRGFDDTNEKDDGDDDGVTESDLTGMDIFLSRPDCFKAGCQSKTYLGMRKWSKGRWMLLLIHLLLSKISRRLPLKKS